MKKKSVIAYFTGIAVGLSLMTAVSASAYPNGEAREAREITEVEINAENFPDANFRKYLKEKEDRNGDGILNGLELLTSYIDAYGRHISDLTGIEFFTELELLYCNNNELTSLDVSHNKKLKALDCFNNQLETLVLGEQNNLNRILCQNNELTELDVSTAPNITEIMCFNNKLTSLDVTKNTKLANLQAGNTDESGQNSYAAVDFSENTELKTLGIENCGLLSLDISRNTALTSLICEKNDLTSLDISANTLLNTLKADGNSYDLGDRTEFDLEELEQYGFDIAKMSDIRGAVLKDNMLTDFSGFYSEITYMYDIGAGKTQKFTLTYTAEKAEAPEEPSESESQA